MMIVRERGERERKENIRDRIKYEGGGARNAEEGKEGSKG